MKRYYYFHKSGANNDSNYILNFPSDYLLISCLPNGAIRGIVTLDDEKHLQQFRRYLVSGCLWLLDLDIERSIEHFKNKHKVFAEQRKQTIITDKNEKREIIELKTSSITGSIETC